MSPLSDAARRIGTEMSLDREEEKELREFLAAAERTADSMGVRFDEVRAMALAAHSAAFIRRVRDNASLPDVSGAFFAEIDDDVRDATFRVLLDHTHGRDFVVRDEEVLLFAIHFQIAKSSTWR